MVSNIWVAASDNNIKLVQQYIDSGKFTANSKDEFGYTPIHAAASYSHFDLLKYLLVDCKGDVNIQDADGDTPLHHTENVEVAKLLIEKYNANKNIKNLEGKTALEAISDDLDEGADNLNALVKYLESLETGMENNEQRNENESLKNVRVSYENIEENSVDEEQRKKIEAIINGENPEEELKKFFADTIHKNVNKLKDQEVMKQNEEDKTKKRKTN